MRIGEYLFCSVDSGCKPCPICKSKVSRENLPVLLGVCFTQQSMAGILLGFQNEQNAVFSHLNLYTTHLLREDLHEEADVALRLKLPGMLDWGEGSSHSSESCAGPRYTMLSYIHLL